MITTGGEGHFYWKKDVGYWWNNTWVSDYNYNGQGIRYSMIIPSHELISVQLARILTSILGWRTLTLEHTYDYDPPAALACSMNALFSTFIHSTGM